MVKKIGIMFGMENTFPPALVEKMAKAFLDTGGDLKHVARVMVSSDEAWTQPPAKLKRTTSQLPARPATGPSDINSELDQFRSAN